LSVRGNRAVWESQGAQDTYQLARRRVGKMAAVPAKPLPPATQAKLDEIIASF
jgi:hypothetical protein